MGPSIMFDDLNKSLAKFKELAGTWPALMVMGSFVLYVLGYLSVRFNLTVLGIGTDLAVVDERYIFAGAKFVVYLLATLPIIGMFIRSARHLLARRCLGELARDGPFLSPFD